jgi:hypothetical protein
MPRKFWCSFATRVDPNVDARRRRLQRQLDCTTTDLVDRALRALEADVTRRLNPVDRDAYFQEIHAEVQGG